MIDAQAVQEVADLLTHQEDSFTILAALAVAMATAGLVLLDRVFYLFSKWGLIKMGKKKDNPGHGNPSRLNFITHDQWHELNMNVALLAESRAHFAELPSAVQRILDCVERQEKEMLEHRRMLNELKSA